MSISLSITRCSRSRQLLIVDLTRDNPHDQLSRDNEENFNAAPGTHLGDFPFKGQGGGCSLWVAYTNESRRNANGPEDIGERHIQSADRQVAIHGSFRVTLSNPTDMKSY